MHHPRELVMEGGNSWVQSTPLFTRVFTCVDLLCKQGPDGACQRREITGVQRLSLSATSRVAEIWKTCFDQVFHETREGKTDAKSCLS